MTDDSAIVDLYLLRDESAIALTAEKYGRQLRRLAENILEDRFLAEECENDTYLQAWNSIPPHEPRSYLFSFLGMITRNLAIDACRKIKRRQQKAEFSELSEELEECLPGRENVEESVEAAFLRESFNRFLDGCTEIQRDVFLRRYWYFDTIPKISRRYGFTQSKVKMMLLRMREELRKHLQREGYQI